VPAPHRLPAEQRRQAILQAALRLFSQRGFRGATTRALADAVGVSEPVLYEHFRSKRELFAALVEAKSREGLEQATALLKPYVKARDDRGFFTRLGEFILERYQADPAYPRLVLFAALEDPELGALFYERQREARKYLADYIRQRIREGVFRPVDPALAARAFLGMLFHHGQVGVLYRDGYLKASLKEIVEGMVDIFLSGIARGAAEAAPAGRAAQEVLR